MTREELLNIIVAAGDERKKEQHLNAKRATKDAEDSQLATMIVQLREGIEAKSQKVTQLEQQKKNLELEISGLEAAQNA